MSIFEIIMLLCFGAAWPFSIAKSIKSKSTKGKSLVFLFVLMIGYMSGIIHKIVYDFDQVVLLYMLNLSMVTFDTFLWFKNRKLEKSNERGK